MSFFADRLWQREDSFTCVSPYWEQIKDSDKWAGTYIIWLLGGIIWLIGMYLHSSVKKIRWVDDHSHSGEPFMLNYSDFNSLQA